MKLREYGDGESQISDIAPVDFSVSLADLIITFAKKWPLLLIFTILGITGAGFFVSVSPKPHLTATYLLEPVQVAGMGQVSFRQSSKIFNSLRFSRDFSNEFISKLLELTKIKGELNEPSTIALSHLKVQFGFAEGLGGESLGELQTAIALEFYRARSLPSYEPMIQFNFANIDDGRVEVRTIYEDDAVVLVFAAIEAYNATVLKFNSFERNALERQRSSAIEHAVESFSQEYLAYERTLPAFDRKKVRHSLELARLSTMVERLEKRSGVANSIEKDEIGVRLSPDKLGSSEQQVNNLGSFESNFSLLAQEVRLENLTNRLGKLHEIGVISKATSDQYMDKISQIISSRRQLKNSTLTSDYQANDAFRRFKSSLDGLPTATEIELKGVSQARVSLDMIKYLKRSGLLVSNPVQEKRFGFLVAGGCFGFALALLLIFVYTIVLRLKAYSQHTSSKYRTIED